MKTHTVTVSLDEKQYRRLAASANSESLPIASMARHLIALGVEVYDDQEAELQGHMAECGD